MIKPPRKYSNSKVKCIDAKFEQKNIDKLAKEIVNPVMRSANYTSAIKEHGLVLLFFTLLTLILTYPVITELTSYLAGGGADGFIILWGIWHVNQALKEGGGISDLYHSDILFYPRGANLEFHNFSLTNTLFLAFPLTLITDNWVLIYNTLFLFNFIMAGYAMYLLVKYLVKDKAIAFLVGFAYTFSPLHMAFGVSSFLPEMSFLWTPLFLLFFFKMFEEEKLRNAIIAAIFLFFLALASWYHLVFAFLIVAPYFIYKIFTAPALFNKHFFLRVTMLLLLFGIIMWPFIFPIISAYSGGEYGARAFTEITILHYILPNPFHPIWGKMVIDLKDGYFFGGWGPLGKTVTPGYLVIFISLLYLVKTRKHLFWFLLVIFFSLISINPQEMVGSVLKYIPFINIAGQLHFFAFGVLFSLLLFFAFALSYFLPKWKEVLVKRYSLSFRYVQHTLFFLTFSVLILEYLFMPINYPTTSPTSSHGHVAGQIIKSTEKIIQVVRGPHPSLGEDFSILSLPSSLNTKGGYQILHYFQIFHGKPIFGGGVSRRNVIENERLAEVERIFSNNEVNEVRKFLTKYKVGYIIGFDYDMARIYTGPHMDSPIIKEQILSSLFLLQKIPGEFALSTSSIRGFYVYEVWPEE